jgi:hypothetical protein
MSSIDGQRLLDTRRKAELAALAGARRIRRRDLVLVELYLAQISSNRGRRARLQGEKLKPKVTGA